MIKLKHFRTEDWSYLQKWIKNEAELMQFAGPIFSFPIDQKQVKNYLSESNRTVFRIETENNQIVGVAEISIEKENVAKLARILIGEKSMRGKGVGTQLINKLTDYAFKELEKKKIILNVYSWNIGAIKCYEKAGYYRTNRTPIKTKVGNEEWETIEMEKAR